MNFITQEIKRIHNFKANINYQPQYFSMNTDQDVFLICNNTKCLYMNTNLKVEKELDEEYGMTQFKTVLFDS